MRHDRLPLVLVPGLLCTARLWRDQVEDLSDVAIPMVTAQHVRFDDVEDIAAAVLAEAPQEFALAGLSFGGYVAMAIARRAPERLLGLALVDTTARPDSEERKVQRAELIRQSGQGRFIGVADRLLPILVHPDRLDDEALTGATKEMAVEVGREAFVRQQTAIMARPDARPQLGRLTVPRLVMCGREDALTPLADHEEMHGLMPGSRLVVVERCGHLAPMERPAATSAALRDWLAAIG